MNAVESRSYIGNLKLSKELPALPVFNPKKDTVEVFKQKIRQELKSNLLEMDDNPQLAILYLMRFLSPETKELLDISSIPGAGFSDQEYIDAIQDHDYRSQLSCIFRLLQNSYDANESKKDLLLKWETAKQESTETVSQFCNRLLYLQDRLVRAGFGEKNDSILAIKLQAGCKENLQRWLKTYVNDHDLEDFQRLRDRLIRYESNAITEGRAVIDLDAAYKAGTKFTRTSKMNQIKTDSCNRCGQKGHFASDCQAPRPNHVQPRCYTCSGFGHKSDQCSRDPATLKCGRCGKAGHTAPVCMAKVDTTKTTKSSSNAKSKFEVESLSYDLCHSNLKISDSNALKFLNIYHGEIFLDSVMIDSGAELSITTSDTLKNWELLHVPIELTSRKISVRMANGIVSESCPIVLVTFGLFSGDSRQIPMAVLNGCTKKCILAFNVLRESGIIWIATKDEDKFLQVPNSVTVDEI